MSEFIADKIKVYGPKSDGGYTVTLDVGEYMQKNIAKLMLIPQHSTIKVKVEKYDEESGEREDTSR